jgi:hypothetical protein
MRRDGRAVEVGTSDDVPRPTGRTASKSKFGSRWRVSDTASQIGQISELYTRASIEVRTRRPIPFVPGGDDVASGLILSIQAAYPATLFAVRLANGC